MQQLVISPKVVVSQYATYLKCLSWGYYFYHDLVYETPLWWTWCKVLLGTYLLHYAIKWILPQIPFSLWREKWTYTPQHSLYWCCVLIRISVLQHRSVMVELTWCLLRHAVVTLSNQMSYGMMESVPTKHLSQDVIQERQELFEQIQLYYNHALWNSASDLKLPENHQALFEAVQTISQYHKRESLTQAQVKLYGEMLYYMCGAKVMQGTRYEALRRTLFFVHDLLRQNYYAVVWYYLPVVILVLLLSPLAMVYP